MWIYSNELTHYGILGMKWGVRRYQNEDGTLTEEGKKRYSTLLEPSIKIKDKPNQSPAERALKSTKGSIDSAKEVVSSVKKLKGNDDLLKKIKGMSDSELREAINRLDLEKRYVDLSKQDISNGSDKLTEILSITGGVVGILGGLATAYAAIKLK